MDSLTLEGAVDILNFHSGNNVFYEIIFINNDASPTIKKIVRRYEIMPVMDNRMNKEQKEIYGNLQTGKQLHVVEYTAIQAIDKAKDTIDIFILKAQEEKKQKIADQEKENLEKKLEKDYQKEIDLFAAERDRITKELDRESKKDARTNNDISNNTFTNTFNIFCGDFSDKETISELAKKIDRIISNSLNK